MCVAPCMFVSYFVVSDGSHRPCMYHSCGLFFATFRSPYIQRGDIFEEYRFKDDLKLERCRNY